MRIPAVPRHRIPALIATALFHVLVVVMLIAAMPKRFERQLPLNLGRETITFLPLLTPPPEIRRTRRRAHTSGPASAAPYFNPDTYHGLSPATPAQPNLQGLQLALAACAPEHYDMASAEVRAVCGKIGALLANDSGHFGVKQDVDDPRHWQRELSRREAPYLAPCMSPNGFSPLYTLLCVYDTLVHGYDPEKRARYSE